MHIPENYLSPSTCGVMAAAMIPVWIYSVKKVKEEVPKEKMPLLGVGAAFSFLGMMFNVPLPGGTTGHAVGGTLLALLLGPEAACISLTIALFIQAFLFGDGGILAFGANCFNIAFVLPVVGYYITKFFSGYLTSEKGRYISAAIGAYAGINAAAFCAAIEFGIQPYLFQDAAGQPLYCPYGFAVSVPAMMIGHLTIIGIAEIIFTTAILAFIHKTSPDIVKPLGKTNKKPVYALIAVLILAVPVGLLAEGTAWGEWGVDEIAKVVSRGAALGYTPSGMRNGFQLSVLCPDYTMAGLPDTVAYLLSAVIGVAISIIIFKVIASFMREKIDFSTQQQKEERNV